MQTRTDSFLGRFSSSRQAFAFALLSGGVALASCGSLRAQTTYTYTGPATGGLDTATNWTPNGVPASTTTTSDTATFNGSTTGALNLAEATANAFGGAGGNLGALINVTSGQTSNVTLTGASIRVAGVTIASGAGAISFQNTVLFGGFSSATTQTFTNNSTNALTFTTVQPGGGGLRTLDFEGTGNANITGNIASTAFIAVQKGTAGSVTDGGNLSLSGANAYSAGTVINAGSLLVSNTSGSATGTGAVSVASGGTLTGGSGAANSGTASLVGTGGNVPTFKTYAPGVLGLVTGPVTVASAGRLAPGKTSVSSALSVGTITIGALTLSAGSTAAYEFNTTNGTNDFTAVTGALTLAGTAVNPTAISLLQEGSATAFATSGVYNLFSYGAGSSINTAGLSIANQQSGFNYTFVNDTTDSLVQLDITAVPEPSTWTGSVLCLLFAAGYCLKRRGSVAGGLQSLG